MSATITNPPQWNAAVTSAKLGNGVALLSNDVDALNKKIQDFVQTSFFQNKVSELSNGAKGAFTIQLIFEDGAIKLKKQGSKDGTLTLPASTDNTAMKETTDLVKNIAKYYLSPQTPKECTKSLKTNAPDLKLLGTEGNLHAKATDNDLQNYNVHGITNPDSKYCYANSTYQILANIPSLKTTFLDNHQSLKYENIKDGKILISNINTATKISKFQEGEVGDTTDVFLALATAQKPAFNTFTFEEESMKVENLTSDSSISEENFKDFLTKTHQPNHETASIFTLGIPQSGNPNFRDIISSKLAQKTNILNHKLDIPPSSDAPPPSTALTQATVNYDKKTTHKFSKQPDQLLIQIERKSAATQTVDHQFIEGIPMVLNLQEYNAIKDPREFHLPLELKGFTVHQGEDGSNGHYIAYFKKENPIHNGNHQWFCANDDKIFTVNEGNIPTLLGYACNLYYDDTKTLSIQETSTPLVSYIASINGEDDENDNDEFHDADDGSSSPENATTSTNKPVVPIQADDESDSSSLGWLFNRGHEQYNNDDTDIK